MAQPPAYNRDADFTKNHGSVQNDTLLNAELDDVSTSINAIRENLAIIQDDDGGLKEGIVTKDNFTQQAYADLVDDVVEQVNPQIETIQSLADSAEQAAQSAAADAAAARQDADAAAQSASDAAGSASTSEQTVINIQNNLPTQIAGYVTSLDLPQQIEDEVQQQLDDLAVDERLNQNLAMVEEGLAQIPQQVATATSAAVEAEDIPSQVENAVDAAIVDGLVDALGYTPADNADLTAESTARQNADAALQTAVDGKADDSTVVKHTAQALTTEQALQARTNIGALGYTVSQVVNFQRGIRGLNVQGQTDDANNWYGNSGCEQIYYNNALAGADNISNLPKQAPFMLISRTARSGSNPQTIHQTCYIDGEVYTRTRKNSTWENWKIADRFGYTGIKCGKRIVFTADKKFPDYDVLLTRMVQGGGVPAYIYPQAPAVFSKDGKNYLFVLQTPGGTTGTITSVTYAVTVYDLDTYDYLGCFLLPNSSLGQGIVVRTESAGDFIYTKNSSNELVKSQFSVSNLTGALDTSNINSEIARVTLTPQVVKNSNNESIKYVSFLSRLNGKWLIDNTSARVSGDSQNAMLFLNDTFDVVGVFDIQKFEKDIFTGYKNSDSGSWTIPKTQGISIGVDGVYLFKGGGTSAADTATALTDCGVDHYSFNGDLVRTSVCDHTLFAGRMLSLLGLTSSINHSESEGGFCTEDGKCYWFGVFAAHTGKIALLEEFSDAPDAVDFSDCMAVRRTNIPCRSNVPTFPKANGVRNPWTGEELTSLTAFVEMCAKYGIDDISLSCFGMTWQPKILNTTVWGSTSFVINLLRMHNNRYFAEIKGYSSYLKLFSIGLTNGAVSECVEVTQPSFVVESGTNYKRYSDGTQECWGGGTTSSTPTAVDFPKPFSEAPTVVISGQSGSVDMQMRLYKAAAVSASGFTPVATNITATSYSAITYRYFARGKWSA